MEFTSQEIFHLRLGAKKFGTLAFDKILLEYEFNNGRTAEQLREKWIQLNCMTSNNNNDHQASRLPFKTTMNELLPSGEGSEEVLKRQRIVTESVIRAEHVVVDRGLYNPVENTLRQNSTIKPRKDSRREGFSSKQARTTMMKIAARGFSSASLKIAQDQLSELLNDDGDVNPYYDVNVNSGAVVATPNIRSMASVSKNPKELSSFDSPDLLHSKTSSLDTFSAVKLDLKQQEAGPVGKRLGPISQAKEFRPWFASEAKENQHGTNQRKGKDPFAAERIVEKICSEIRESNEALQSPSSPESSSSSESSCPEDEEAEQEEKSGKIPVQPNNNDRKWAKLKIENEVANLTSIQGGASESHVWRLLRYSIPQSVRDVVAGAFRILSENQSIIHASKESEQQANENAQVWKTIREEIKTAKTEAALENILPLLRCAAQLTGSRDNYNNNSALTESFENAASELPRFICETWTRWYEASSKYDGNARELLSCLLLLVRSVHDDGHQLRTNLLQNNETPQTLIEAIRKQRKTGPACSW